MLACFGSLSVVPWILFAQASWNLDAVPATAGVESRSNEAVVQVRDAAGAFSRGAERRAREALRGIAREHRTPIVIETVRSLDGAWIADVAMRSAGRAPGDRLYILVAPEERDVGVVGARHGPASRLTDPQRGVIRRAFLGPIQAGNTDAALEQGISAIRAGLDAAAATPGWGVPGALTSAALLLSAILASWVWARKRVRSEQDREATELTHDRSTACVAVAPMSVLQGRESAGEFGHLGPGDPVTTTPAAVHRGPVRGPWSQGVETTRRIGSLAMSTETNQIYVTRLDRERLEGLLAASRSSDADGDLDALRMEIERAEIVEADEIPPDVVTMNSTVLLVDVADAEEDEYTLVFPGDADADAGKVSIFAPLGTAMLGYRVGDVFDWDVPMGRRRWRISRLVYQPEAAGDYHL